MSEEKNLEETISTIYQKYHLDVYRFLICFSGDRHDAEDLTQEVFIRVLNNLNNFHHGNNLKTWIFSIAKHVAIDHYRKKRFISIFKEGFFHQLISSEKRPTEIIEQNEVKDQLHNAISRLRPQYRAVVLLRGINNFSIKEAAEILSCSESKIKVDYHRALKELKRTVKFDLKEAFGNAN